MKKLTSITLTIEDRIVLTRFIVGLVFGVSVFIASFFVNPLVLSIHAWTASVIVYYITVIYIALKYRPTSKFQLYLRGFGTFYATWLLTAILLNEAFLYLGVKS